MDTSLINQWLDQVRALAEPAPTVLRQFVTVVRHGHRLDREDRDTWKRSRESADHPYDSPLTQRGRNAARTVGETLKAMDAVARWGLVITSPYVRCVQTAAEIAQVLQLPMVFDVEFGEVFDEVYMPNAGGKVQHRPAEQLIQIMEKEYPGVEVAVKSVFGKQPFWPESFSDAQVRFLERFETTCVKAVERMASPIIVTHGDAVMILLALLCPRFELNKIDYCGFFVGWRDTEKPDKSDPMWREKVWDVPKQLSIYQQKWNISIGYWIKYMPKADSLSAEIEAACMQEHAKQHVGWYRRNLKAERNMWTLSPDAQAGIKKTQEKLAKEQSAKTDEPLKKWEDDEGGDAPSKDVRSRKKHLTATADLMKKVAPHMQNVRQHVDQD